MVWDLVNFDSPLGSRPVIIQAISRPGQSIPEGHAIEFEGAKVFLRDPLGNRKPCPDGVYERPNGGKFRVLGGEKRR